MDGLGAFGEHFCGHSVCILWDNRSADSNFLSALPVPMLRQVYFDVFFGCLFGGVFRGVLLKSLGSHFGDI